MEAHGGRPFPLTINRNRALSLSEKRAGGHKVLQRQIALITGFQKSEKHHKIHYRALADAPVLS
jgi:hypothetical protein